MKKRFLVSLMSLALAACGGVSDSDIKGALEADWEHDPVSMSERSGASIAGLERGAVRGTARSLRTARDATSSFTAGVVGEVAKMAIEEGGHIATEFGIEGAEEFHRSMGLANASDWTVRNLEVLSSRTSGESHIARTRYDLSATLNGKDELLGQDLSHTIRLVRSGGDWIIQVDEPIDPHSERVGRD